jgi:hypothetical protein
MTMSEQEPNRMTRYYYPGVGLILGLVIGFFVGEIGGGIGGALIGLLLGFAIQTLRR